MKTIRWEVQFLDLPCVLKYCKRCGKETAFHCAKKFRVNAQRKHLDIWLLYKCADCDTTWNASVHSRISPQACAATRLEGFQRNDSALAEEYAMNRAFLHGNGVKIAPPRYCVIGEVFSLQETVKLEIRSKYAFPLKAASLVRKKLHVSQTAFAQLLETGKLASMPAQDLQRCKLKEELVLLFNP